MLFDRDKVYRFTCVLLAYAALTSCVTKTIEPPAMRFSDTAIIAVQDPDIVVSKGSTIAWLPEATRFYDDERLNKAPIKKLIESEIEKNLKAKGMTLVESVNGARYAIAYTAALESSLDDTAIIRRFGMSPGHSQIPKDDVDVEKGSLIIYVFDNKGNDVVWRSAAQIGVRFDTSDEERAKRVQLIVAEMFLAFKVEQ
jgi:hypothetical protein